jgi:CO dehydrogenase maturation factor
MERRFLMKIAIRGLSELILHRKEVIIVDMEAGIEHLGRATAQSIDRMLIVVEPGLRSIQTAHTILKMGKDIRVPSFGILAVLSRLNFKESIKPFCHRKTNQRGTLPLNIE